MEEPVKQEQEQSTPPPRIQNVQWFIWKSGCFIVHYIIIILAIGLSLPTPCSEGQQMCCGHLHTRLIAAAVFVSVAQVFMGLAKAFRTSQCIGEYVIVFGAVTGIHMWCDAMGGRIPF